MTPSHLSRTSQQASMDRTDLAWWFPLIAEAGLPVPRTEIVTTDLDLYDLLDGETPDGFADFMPAMHDAANRVGYPAFLRTGHGSGKHEWSRTCFVEDPSSLTSHVVALVEWSACVDLVGLPTRTWALREMIPTAPICRCEGYGGMPVVREFRLFVRNGYIEHLQPYWPYEAVKLGRPDREGWQSLLDIDSQLRTNEICRLLRLGRRASEAVGNGYWSIDFLQDAEGEWWLTDMADGDRSYRYAPGEED